MMTQSSGQPLIGRCDEIRDTISISILYDDHAYAYTCMMGEQLYSQHRLMAMHMNMLLNHTGYWSTITCCIHQATLLIRQTTVIRYPNGA